MIEQIVKNTATHEFHTLADIKEKLDYFRELSARGLHALTPIEFESLKQEYKKFFNLNLAIFADKYPTKLFRLTNNKRLYEGNHQKLQKITQLTGPPPEKSWYGRCNLPGESIFYAALDLRTAIWETKPEVGDYVTISEWKIKEGQRIYTHTIFPR